MSAAASGGVLDVPESAAAPITDQAPRCFHDHPRQPGRPCGALLARMVTRPWVIDCKRCGNRNERK